MGIACKGSWKLQTCQVKLYEVRKKVTHSGDQNLSLLAALIVSFLFSVSAVVLKSIIAIILSPTLDCTFFIVYKFSSDSYFCCGTKKDVAGTMPNGDVGFMASISNESTFPLAAVFDLNLLACSIIPADYGICIDPVRFLFAISV